MNSLSPGFCAHVSLAKSIAGSRSSIFRCLGGLWSVPCGVIRKPGGSADGVAAGASNDAMFYIPQSKTAAFSSLRTWSQAR